MGYNNSNVGNKEIKKLWIFCSLCVFKIIKPTNTLSVIWQVVYATGRIIMIQ